MPPELPEIQAIEKEKKSKKKSAKRPKSAPDNALLPLLPSESLRRAKSARAPQLQEEAPVFSPLHSKGFDSQLLDRLKSIKPDKKINPLHPLVGAEKVTFEDASVSKVWRTFSRPQSAVESAMTTPRPTSSRPVKSTVHSRYLESPSRPLSSRPLTARSRVARRLPPIQQEKKTSVYDSNF